MRGALRLLALLSLPAAVAAADSVLPKEVPDMWSDSANCSIFVAVSGEFSSRAPDRNNYMNAEHGRAALLTAPPLHVTAAELALLNQALAPTVDELVRQLRLQRLPSRATTLPPLALERAGDRAFSLDVRVSPVDTVGGHLGGLDVELRLRSLQRTEEVEGRGVETVRTGLPDETSQRRELRAALVRALATARRDLSGRLAAPTVALTIEFRLEGLAPAARADLERQIAPCAVGLGRAARVTGPTRAPDALRFVADYRLDGTVSAEEYARQLAGWIEAEVGPHGKHRCSLWRTTLVAHGSAHVEVRARTLTVTLPPPPPTR